MHSTQTHGLNDPDLLARLVDVSVTLNSNLELGPLLEFLLGTAADLLECERASILLYNEKRGDLSFLSATSSDVHQLAEIPVPLDRSIAGAIFRSNQPLIINDAASDPRHFAQVGEKTGYQTRSLLGVPMRLRGETTGVLEAVNKRQGDFTDIDAQVLAVVASQSAVAIHNAQLVQDLRRAHDELSRVDRIKSNFMHLASHELRTPLAIIMSYAEFLRQDALRHDPQGTLSAHAVRVLEAAQRQRAIIDSMTNMNLLQLGAVDLQLTRMPLQKALRSAYEEVRELAAAKRQRVELTLPDEPVYVKADAARLALVFINVLDNAIQFTPTGGDIHINVQPQAGEALVVVRDTGAGIPPGELTNIFKDYYQVEDHMTRRHGGLGLGLAIARGIIHLHNGRIWAESEGPNQGATIQVVLPREE
ncbi:MAG: ATP-binding protein [Gemmataceae bacterium]|nr:ATP-binding protein [Gemmataceae bacterium]